MAVVRDDETKSKRKETLNNQHKERKFMSSTRFSLSKMTQVIRDLKTDPLSKQKREALRKAGFESLLTLNDRTVNPNTKRWFYYNFQWRTSTIPMPDGKRLKFQKEDVQRVYGLPINGLPIKAEDAEQHSLNDLIREFESDDAAAASDDEDVEDDEKKKGAVVGAVTSRSHVHVRKIFSSIKECCCSEDNVTKYVRLFVLLFIGTMVKPRANYTVDLAVYAHALRDIQTIAQFDWCGHLYNALVAGFRYRGKYFEGDLYLLECHVLDKYSEGKLTVPPPTCAVWTTSMCNEFGADIKYPGNEATADVERVEDEDAQPVAKTIKCEQIEEVADDDDQPIAKRMKCVQNKEEENTAKLLRFVWLKKEMNRLVGVIQQANTEMNSLMDEFLQLGTELGVEPNADAASEKIQDRMMDLCLNRE